MSLYFNVYGLHKAALHSNMKRVDAHNAVDPPPTVMENPGVSVLFLFFGDYLGEYTGQE